MTSSLLNAYDEELDDSKLRLLEIEVPPQEEKDSASSKPISCRLVTFPNNNTPNFTCWSYAWDEPLANRYPVGSVVHVNGIEVAVQPNLVHALRQYHTAVYNGIAVDYKPTWFWIDAICINQSSTAERTAQVSIMYKIYRFAWKILVWLGPDPDNEAYVVREFFRALLQRYYSGIGRPKYTEGFLSSPARLSAAGAHIPSDEADIWRLTVRFWERSWFGRAWVVQEVALAQQPEFWCGGIMFTLPELAGMSNFFALSGLGWTLLPLRRNPSATDRKRQGRMLGKSPGQLQALRELVFKRARWEAEDSRNLADRVTGPVALDAEGKSEISMLREVVCGLYQSLTTDASDDRDKVFALLMLFKQIALANGFEELPLKVDYAKSVADVYRETTAWVITESRWLGILGFVNQRRTLEECQRKSMPSWVIDFRATEPMQPTLLQHPGAHQERLAQAMGLMNDSNRPQVKEGVLEVSIKRIGTIISVGGSEDDIIHNGDLEKTAKLLLECPRQINSSGMTRIDWFIHTLLGRQCQGPCDTDIRTDFAYFLKAVIMRRIHRDVENGQIKYAWDFFVHQRSVQQLAVEDETRTVATDDDWRRIFQSAEEVADIQAQAARRSVHKLDIQGRRVLLLGELGLSRCPVAKLLAVGPEATVLGDEVCLVAGSMMPFVLRRANAGRTRDQVATVQQAYFIGEAYVNGGGEPADMFGDDEEWQRWHLL